ncbi:caspase, EACC1-associated type [Argonema antarcticum]|uniref:caspase, EACC1-associated type n=1 Tax=Argonema antarcticum TaxID=2942763 RepID=UPI002012C773|nr:SUMF1/EgtB/PvdO family nonheme iron enzyme [Argonema antarcticum]MCL1469370.1 SUMF1/EgtB/PvdO family nonheme iron enzyme [Argonema antarcticum A004/B2]
MPRKVALLIGVSEYGEGIPPLSAPPNDVAAMKRVLENHQMGQFDEVETLIDPELVQMTKAIQKLFKSCGKDDLVLLFFSGHGITDDDNKLYLATRLTAKDDFEATAVPASFVQQQSKNSYAKRQAIILDCCYSGAFAEGWQTKSVGIDFKKELGAEGRVVLTSSTATQPSYQQEDLSLSLYTQYLVEGIETGAADKDGNGKIYAQELHEYAKTKVREVKPKMEPGIILDKEGFNILLSLAPVNNPELKFRQEVEKYAGRGEISKRAGEILKVKQREFRLSDEKAEEIIHSVLEPFHQRLVNLNRYKDEYRKEVQRQYPLDEATANELKDWQLFVLGFRDEDVVDIQQQVIAEIVNKDENDEIDLFEFEVVKVNIKGEIEKKKKQRVRYFTEDLGNDVKLDMVCIPGGTFTMGSPETEKESLDSERPQHQVTIKPFFMGKNTVTQAQWKVVANLPKVNLDLNSDPSRFKGANRPVECVSWYDAVEFCARLSRHTGKTYRLPSESEWEYACRAGTTTPFSFGETITSELANYNGNYTYGSGPKGKDRQETTPVGSFPPNTFGIYDMHGNVWEWCADHWHDNYQAAPSDETIWLTRDERSARLLRGGSWLNDPVNCRSAFRVRFVAGGRGNYIGFRVVCLVAWTL